MKITKINCGVETPRILINRKLMKHLKLIIFIIFCLLLAGYSYFIEPNSLEVNRYIVQDEQLKGVKIVFASDFHIKPYGQKRLDMIVEKINAENPDFVVSAGDFVCGHTHHSTMPIEQIAKTLGKVKAKFGFYTSLGNHDGWYGNDEITKNLEQNGIKVLSNSNISLNIRGQKLYIAGIEDYDTGGPNIFKALEGVEVDENGRYNKPIIMLSHTPDMFPKMPDEITLVLAGHCHGGQIRISFLGPIFTASRYGDKYAKGWKQEKDGKSIKIDTSKPIKLQKDISTLFVTRGIGVSILPLRFNCPPEINIIEFQ